MTKELPNLHVDELKNFTTNILPQVGVLVMYWDPCIIG